MKKSFLVWKVRLGDSVPHLGLFLKRRGGRCAMAPFDVRLKSTLKAAWFALQRLMPQRVGRQIQFYTKTYEPRAERPLSRRET
jgi:hypothetical protein